MDDWFTSAWEIRERILRRQVSAVETVTAAIERMNAVNPKINAFVTNTPELAIQSAQAVDRAIASGQTPGLLHGIPISVKDLIHVGGVRTTFGSKVMENNIATNDAPAVERIRRHGACILGKTTTTEFGCKAGGGDSPVSGVTRNPWNLSKCTGGSSAGSAASVAAGVTPFALGTDGGGSVRIPAALTGLVGVKAQFGRVPVFPTSATPTLAHVGVLARTVRDAALLLQATSGFDPRDPASIPEQVPDYLGACDSSVEGLRIAWSPTLGYANPSSEVVDIVQSAVEKFEQSGCHVDLVEDVCPDPVEMWMAEFYAGVGVTLRDAVRSHTDELDPAVADILAGALNLSLEQYYTSVFNRYAFREVIRNFFNRYDLLLTPTLPVTSLDAGENVPGGLKDRNIVSWVYYTYPFNLTGNPAASIPCGLASDGMPVGLQIVARQNREVDVIRMAAAFERAYPWGFPDLTSLLS